MDAALFSFRNVWRAYLLCRANKRNSRSALAFEMNAEENVLDLSRRLRSRAYRPLRSVCFVTESPKPREIFAAHFEDRIVHHLLVSHLEPKWEPKFIHDSFACRKGKGTHAAVLRLQGFMRKATRNRTRRAFYLHLDIRSFFVSIHKRTLLGLLLRREENPDVRWLLETVVFHDPARNPIIKNPLERLRRIPPHKSLFHTRNETGLPIGNHTSQFFANVYLDPLDQFVKHRLKCRYYLRYVDDLVLLSRDRKELEGWASAIEEFLGETLRLRLNDGRRRLSPVASGCDFLGYVVRPSHVLVRKRVVNNLKHRLSRFEARLAESRDGFSTFRHDEETLASLQAVLGSYLGHFRHASAHRLKAALWDRYSFLAHFFEWKNGKLARKDVPPRFHRLSRQYGWFSKNYSDFFLFFQIGCFYEFYREREAGAKETLALRPGRRRRGLGPGRGFHVSGLSAHIAAVLENSEKVMVVNQTQRHGYCLMERRLHMVILSDSQAPPPARGRQHA